MQDHSREANGAHTAVGVRGRRVGASDHSLLTELQTHKFIDLQGLDQSSTVDPC